MGVYVDSGWSRHPTLIFVVFVGVIFVERNKT